MPVTPKKTFCVTVSSAVWSSPTTKRFWSVLVPKLPVLYWPSERELRCKIEGNFRVRIYMTQFTGADLGFYKGGCPIHLKGAPPPNYFDPCYRKQRIFRRNFKKNSYRRNSWRQAVVRHLELCQIPYSYSSCFVFTKHPVLLKTVRTWFQNMFFSKKGT